MALFVIEKLMTNIEYIFISFYSVFLRI